MSEPGARPAPGAAQQAAVPEGLVPAVVHLVNTGPVLLGAYTIAELTAVDAVVDFLEARPSDEVVAEAVRSLAARQLQPEKICLQYRIDALGIHEIGLYQLDQALDFLTGWLPGGRRADPDSAADPDSLLASAERSALVTMTRYTTQGSAETAGTSTDLILARHDSRLHVLTRDPADRAKLIPNPAGDEDIRDMLAGLLT
jgi:hypothetical protein